jgi:hypothetical protein
MPQNVTIFGEQDEELCGEGKHNSPEKKYLYFQSCAFRHVHFLVFATCKPSHNHFGNCQQCHRHIAKYFRVNQPMFPQFTNSWVSRQMIWKG